MHALHLARPYAIMMVGYPGSGKTFFASKFSRMFNVPYVDINELQQLVGGGVNIESVVLFFLSEIMKTEQTFIFEGNSATRTNRSEFAKWAREKGYKPLFIWVQTDERTCRGRTMKSKQISPEEFDHQVETFSPPHADEKAVVISGRHTYTSQARAILNHIGSENRGGSPVIGTTPSRLRAR